MKKFLSIIFSTIALSFSGAVEYSNLFVFAANKYSVSHRFLAGIAYAETGAWERKSIRKIIRSKSGAIGIMQIMPSTGKQYCKRLNLEIPYQNISCGAIYIRWLQKHYCSTNYKCIALSYLYGPNAYRKYKYRIIKQKKAKIYWKKVLFGMRRGSRL